MSDTTTQHPHGRAPRPTQVVAWMTVAEGRTALAAAGQPALPVVGHDGDLIGLITIEALGGTDREGPVPHPEALLASVMDWHLVQVPPEADEREVVLRYTDAAWRWLDERTLELQASEGSTS